MFITDGSIEYYFIIQHQWKEYALILIIVLYNEYHEFFLHFSFYRHLHFIDQLGLTYQDPYIATGMGVSFALPLLRKEWRDNLTEEEARAILEQAMRLCYYGDCKMNNRVYRDDKKMMCVVADWKDYSRTMYHFRAFFTWNQLGVSFFYCFIVLFKQHTN